MVNSSMCSDLGEATFALALPPMSSSASDTPGSLPASRGRRSTSSVSKSKKPTRKPKSLPTSALVSISSEKDLLPYWNEQCQALQSMLWCPTPIDCHGLELNSSDLIKRVMKPINSAPNCSLDSAKTKPTYQNAHGNSGERWQLEPETPHIRYVLLRMLRFKSSVRA